MAGSVVAWGYAAVRDGVRADEADLPLLVVLAGRDLSLADFRVSA